MAFTACYMESFTFTTDNCNIYLPEYWFGLVGTAKTKIGFASLKIAQFVRETALFDVLFVRNDYSGFIKFP
jgi:hypothetical protein